MSKYTEDDLKSNSKIKNTNGFYTELEAETSIGLNEDIVRAISHKKGEPQWMTDCLEAFRAWEQMIEPEWANVSYTKPDFQAILLFSTKSSRS
jgi:Fe-S cluster assembly protein SufB